MAEIGGPSYTVGFASATTFLGAPSFTLAAVGASQISISWGSVANADSYEVDELIGGTWQAIDSTWNTAASPAATSFSVTGLAPETVYEFKVAALNLEATEWSNPQAITTGHSPFKIVPS